MLDELTRILLQQPGRSAWSAATTSHLWPLPWHALAGLARFRLEPRARGYECHPAGARGHAWCM